MKLESVSINNHTFLLHPSGAIYWESEQILLIADVHFGKVTHFRKHGSAVPQVLLYENFNYLDEVIELFQPASLYFLGDLFHSYLNNEWQLFAAWVQKKQLSFVLITGNHDIISPLLYEELGFKLLDRLTVHGFLFTHHPTKSNTHFNIAGHIHPGVLMRGLGRQRLSLPCFYITHQQFILPAFGAFTGKYIINPIQGDIIYASAGDEVIRVQLEE